MTGDQLLDRLLERYQAENYIARETLRYIANRSDRLGWLKEHGESVADSGLRVMDTPGEALRYWRMSGEPR